MSASPVIVLTRFGLLAEDMTCFAKSRSTTPGAYSRILFQDTRLELRFKLFQTFWLRSIASQRVSEDLEFSVVVMASEMLPPKWQQKLESLVADIKCCKVMYFGPGLRVRDMVRIALRSELRACVSACGGTSLATGGRLTYATVRLDDDDALSSAFGGAVHRYLKPEFVGFGVSFARGYEVYVDSSGSIEEIWLIKSINLAAGLTYVADVAVSDLADDAEAELKSVYELGDHFSIDERVPVIVDSRVPMFMRSLHREMDSGLGLRRERRRIRVGSIVSDPENILSDFGLSGSQVRISERGRLKEPFFSRVRRRLLWKR